MTAVSAHESNGEAAGHGAEHFAVFPPQLESVRLGCRSYMSPWKRGIELGVARNVREAQLLDLVLDGFELGDIGVGDDFDEAAGEIGLDQELDLVGVAQEILESTGRTRAPRWG